MKIKKKQTIYNEIMFSYKRGSDINIIEEVVMHYILVIITDIGIQWTIADIIQVLKYLNINEALYRFTWLLA